MDSDKGDEEDMLNKSLEHFSTTHGDQSPH
jgi:hypothetical protein